MLHNIIVVEKGGIFWEGGVDSAIRRHLTKSRNGVDPGRRGKILAALGSTLEYNLESTPGPGHSFKGYWYF